jgi:hypothetical protein
MRRRYRSKGQLKAVTCDSQTGKIIPARGNTIWRIVYVANGEWELQRYQAGTFTHSHCDALYKRDGHAAPLETARWQSYQRPTDRNTALRQMASKLGLHEEAHAA